MVDGPGIPDQVDDLDVGVADPGLDVPPSEPDRLHDSGVRVQARARQVPGFDSLADLPTALGP